MEQSSGQCGGYRYTPSKNLKRTKTLRSIKKSTKGGAKHRVKKTRRHTRKH
jgi:hypothetical protein